MWIESKSTKSKTPSLGSFLFYNIVLKWENFIKGHYSMENYNLLQNTLNFNHNYQLDNAISIESGYFVFTLMPSLRCSLNCPHCYLSLEQRRNSEIMSIENLEKASKKVYDYYEAKGIKNKYIVLYWYGGEPTEMGIDYFNKAMDVLNNTFPKEKGYVLKHTVLTSLLTVDTDIWFDFFRKHGEN